MNFDWLERAEVAGAGFINFFLKSDMVYDTLKAILNAGTEYGVQPLRARDTIQVEYNPSTISMMQVIKSTTWLFPLSTVSKSYKVLN